MPACWRRCLPGREAGDLVDQAVTDRLWRCINHLRATENPDDLWLAQALADWLAAPEAGHLTLDTAFSWPPGWRQAARDQARDAALAAIAAQFASTSGRRRAALVEQAIGRYASTVWPRDSFAGRRPSGLYGLVFDYLRVGGRPLSFERFRQMERRVTGRR